MKIGNVNIGNGIILAPMAGVTDSAFRRICKAHGAEYMVSEMISAKAVHYGDKKTGELAKFSESERPFGIQIFGSDADIMAESAAAIECRYRPDIIDINMGCPVQKIVSNGEGSCLMREPLKAAEIIRAVVRAVTVPVTVKVRSGWDSEHINASYIAELAESEGAAAVCVHGRTREQFYAGEVDLEVISEVKKRVKIPVIGNGGIECGEDSEKMMKYCGCDGVMVGRGAEGNPWIFEEIRSMLEGEEYKEPEIRERLETAIEHIMIMIENKGEYIGVREARRHLSWYIKGLEGAASVRCDINRAVTFNELREIIQARWYMK